LQIRIRKNVFDWTDLRYFLAVARGGTTSAAAKALKVNQSTVHRRLAALEAYVGRELIERGPMGQTLSELGKELLPYAEAVEQAAMAFERRSASSEDAFAGTLRVTCSGALAPTVMTPLVQTFRARYPNLKVDLIVSERNLDLSKGEADIAVRAGELRDDTLICRKLAEGSWAVYASHAYIERHGKPEKPEDIKHHSIIAFGGGLADHYFSKWLSAVASTARVAARSETVTGALMALKNGGGVGILPAQLGDAEPDLVRVIGPLPDLRTHFYLVVHPGLQKTWRIRTFIDFLVVAIDAYRPLLHGETRR
jgi:DNA-binding transcriptional LysR family regulator